MAIQLYLVQPTGERDEATRASIAEYVAGLGGFVLMATSYGSLILAFDEEHLPAVRSHSQVEFVGGVTLDPNGPKAEALTRIFAENVALQLASRPAVATSPLPPPFTTANLPAAAPGSTPLRWPVRTDEGGDAEGF
jgi:hypothetical protein